MIKTFMKIGGAKTKEEFYAKYPTEKSFFEAFPQAQQYVKQQGGAQAQDPLSQVIMAVAQQMQVDPQQIVQIIQQDPNIASQLQQMAAQDPQKAAQALGQLIQQASASGGGAEETPMGESMGMDQESAEAQPGEMPMNPEQAMQMAYGGAYKLNKFIRKEGGDIAFPQAAPMYDNSIYRTFPPNFPRLFQEGGEGEEESFGPVKKQGIAMEAYAQAQGLPEVTNITDNTLSVLKKNKSIGPIEGMTVSQIWTATTGLPWSEAKKRGITDGSYKANMALKKELLKGINIQAPAAQKAAVVGSPKGRSAMVDFINDRYIQHPAYVATPTPNRYTSPTQSAIDLYEAGLNYIERNHANPVATTVNTPKQLPNSPNKASVQALWNANVEHTMPEGPYAPAPQVGVSYLPYSDTRPFLGKVHGSRMYAYGGDLDAYQVGGPYKQGDPNPDNPNYIYDESQKGWVLQPKSRWEAFTQSLGDWDLPTLGALLLANRAGYNIYGNLAKPASTNIVAKAEKAMGPTAGKIVKGVLEAPKTPAVQQAAKKLTKAEREAQAAAEASRLARATRATGAAGSAAGRFAAKNLLVPGAYLGYKYMSAPATEGMPTFMPLVESATGAPQERVTVPMAPPASNNTLKTAQNDTLKTAQETYTWAGERAYGGSAPDSIFNYGAFPAFGYGGGASAPMGYTQPDNVGMQKMNTLKQFLVGSALQANQRNMYNEMMGIDEDNVKRRGGSSKKKS